MNNKLMITKHTVTSGRNQSVYRPSNLRQPSVITDMDPVCSIKTDYFNHNSYSVTTNAVSAIKHKKAVAFK